MKVIWNPQQGGKHECVPLEFDKVDNSIACFWIEYKYNKLSQFSFDTLGYCELTLINIILSKIIQYVLPMVAVN